MKELTFKDRTGDFTVNLKDLKERVERHVESKMIHVGRAIIDKRETWLAQMRDEFPAIYDRTRSYHVIEGTAAPEGADVTNDFPEHRGKAFLEGLADDILKPKE